MSELEKVYELAVSLRLAVAKAREENKNIIYSEVSYRRNMKTLQGIAEWALENMSVQQSGQSTAYSGADSSQTVICVTKERNEHGEFIFINQTHDGKSSYPVRFVNRLCGEIGLNIDDLDYVIHELQRQLPLGIKNE